MKRVKLYIWNYEWIGWKKGEKKFSFFFFFILNMGTRPTRPSPMRLGRVAVGLGLGHLTDVGTRPDSAESHATRQVDLDSAMNESGPKSGFLNLGCSHDFCFNCLLFL